MAEECCYEILAMLTTCISYPLICYSCFSSTEPAFSGPTVEVGSEATHTVTRALWTDSGTYTCRANNSLGFAQASATLTVYSKGSYVVHGILIG